MIAIGALGHEVNALLFPAWAASLFLFPPSYARPARLALILAAALPVAVGAAFSVLYVRVPDSAPVCGALVARGLGAAELCGGAIAWLADPENGLAKVAGALARSENLALVPEGWLLCAIPLYRLLRVGAVGRSGLLVVAAGVLPIFLLYPVGLDWGRWLAVQVTVTAFVAMGLGARGQLAQQPGIGPRELALWLLSAASWAPLHGPDIGFPGLLAILF